MTTLVGQSLEKASAETGERLMRTGLAGEMGSGVACIEVMVRRSVSSMVVLVVDFRPEHENMVAVR